MPARNALHIKAGGRKAHIVKIKSIMYKIEDPKNMAAPLENKEGEGGMFFEVSVKARVTHLTFRELITAANEEMAREKMGNIYQSLTPSELKRAIVKPISKEYYAKETRRRYAMREARDKRDK
jgi:hypothetical protein